MDLILCAYFYIFFCSSHCEKEHNTDYVINHKRRLTIKSQALKRKKSKKCAALDKQHTDAEKRQRGRRREQDDKAGMRPRFEKL